jgi:hypothetical protein
VVWKPLVLAMVGMWWKIFCRTPILATHPQAHLRPLVGPHSSGGTANMRLGVGEPPHGVGWGMGPSWSGVSSCKEIDRVVHE